MSRIDEEIEQESQRTGQDLQFFADGTLGALVRWIRILGFPCMFCPRLKPDTPVMPIPPQPGDVILTRQTRLPLIIARDFPQCHCLFITANEWRRQLRQIITELHLTRPTGFLTKCIRCGEELAPCDREGVIDRVPRYVFDTVDEFRQCPQCQRVYWSGTHSRHILAEIEKLFLSSGSG